MLLLQNCIFQYWIPKPGWGQMTLDNLLLLSCVLYKRVKFFVVNLGDWRQVPGWQWSHGQPEPGWLLGRRWFTAGILSGTNTTSYSAPIKHQKKGLRPQTFRSGKCFNPTTSKSRIYVLETFDRFNFIEVCRTINYTRFWVPQHCDLVEHWPLSPIFIRFNANLEEKNTLLLFL